MDRGDKKRNMYNTHDGQSILNTEEERAVKIIYTWIARAVHISDELLSKKILYSELAYDTRA